MTFFILKIVCVAVLLILCAASSLAETAFMSLSRLQLGRLRKVHGDRLEFWEKDPDRTLAVLLLFTNLVTVGAGVLATDLALDSERLFGLPFRWGGWIWPAGTATLLIVFGEILPKVVARISSEPVALFLAPFLSWLADSLGPLLQGLVDATGHVLSFISKSVKAERGTWSAPVIRSLLDNLSIPPPLRSVLRNLLDFGQLPVSKVMIPRAEIFAVDMTLPQEQFIRRILDSGYSRVPVYKGSLDKMIGIVYAKDILASWRTESLIAVVDLLRPLYRVDPSTPLAELLREFRQGKNHMALVTDVGGRAQGLVTLQDVLEAIVGELPPEPDLARVKDAARAAT